MSKDKPQKKKKGRSVQELLGIKTFTKYGLAVGRHELLFFSLFPRLTSPYCPMPILKSKSAI